MTTRLFLMQLLGVLLTLAGVTWVILRRKREPEPAEEAIQFSTSFEGEDGVHTQDVPSIRRGQRAYAEPVPE